MKTFQEFISEDTLDEAATGFIGSYIKGSAHGYELASSGLGNQGRSYWSSKGDADEAHAAFKKHAVAHGFKETAPGVFSHENGATATSKTRPGPGGKTIHKFTYNKNRS